MLFKIYLKNKLGSYEVIAQFSREFDRDICINALSEEFNDVIFYKEAPFKKED